MFFHTYDILKFVTKIEKIGKTAYDCAVIFYRPIVIDVERKRNWGLSNFHRVFVYF